MRQLTTVPIRPPHIDFAQAPHPLLLRSLGRRRFSSLIALLHSFLSIRRHPSPRSLSPSKILCPKTPLFGRTSFFLRNILTRKRSRKNVNRGLYKPKSRQYFTAIHRILHYIRIKIHFAAEYLQIFTRKTNPPTVFSVQKGASRGVLSLKKFTNGAKTTGKGPRFNKSGARRNKSGTC